jgi:putative two-component system response regulator
MRDYSILIVDDNENNREILLRRLERRNHSVTAAENGRRALELIKANSYDLVLLDIMMPEMNGYQVLEHLKADENLRHLPVIVTSGIDDMQSIVRCIEMGAEDYLIKPINNILLYARINASLEKKRLRDQEVHYHKQIEEYNALLESRVREQVREISASQLAIIYGMAKMAEFRDLETGRHLDRVRAYCDVLMKELINQGKYQKMLTPTYIENVNNASPLHDIGKVGIPDQILLKPAKLTSQEFEIIKSHTLIGGDILRAVDREYPGNSFIRVGIEIAETHHEKWNGEGYPNRLAGENIPLSGRIVAIADVYDALISKRVYKSSFTHEESCVIIIGGRDTHFDPVIIDCFAARQKDFEKIAFTDFQEEVAYAG